jgi:hypothetical protein
MVGPGSGGGMIVANRSLPVVLGIDAGLKRDSAAIAVCSWDSGKVRLVNHRIFTPAPDRPLDLEETLEAAVLDYDRRFALREARYDPWQMARSAQALVKAGVPMKEFPQTVPNLTAATSNLFELLKGGNLLAYADPDIRLAVQRCVVVESSRGLRLAKEKGSHKIDIVVALALAALAALAAVEVLSDEGGFDVSATIVQVARMGRDGIKRAVETVGGLLSPDDTDDHPVPSAGEGEAVIITHPGVFDPRTGRPAQNHSSSASCGICTKERRDAAVRARVSYPAVAISIGRIGKEILSDISDPHLRAELVSDPEGVICGGRQQSLRMGHLTSCSEFERSMVIEPRCDSCRKKIGHESDCPRLAALVNAFDPGEW